MPNLKQIESLRNKYNIGSVSNSSINIRHIKALNESFNKSSYQIKSFFSSRGLSSHILEYLEEQKSAEVILLFIDITDFSQKCESLTNTQLSEFLDDYYDKVIPVIYRHGGEIEKIIGDGIICLFGEPFCSASKSELFKKADQCAKDIIVKLKNTSKEVKIAFHDGKIMYYKNKSEDYSEYTMIGKPMTELFRLESVSENNTINFFHISLYDKMEVSKEGVYKVSDSNQHSYWKKSDSIKVDLKGVNWSFIKKFTCTYKT
ncbi:MAG: adenylate/guanylate cyclase domain-containing protein [Erysipelotrichaceae bacterium]|nr:adenylate/guanylate cyclase domain-containing protein [Erysipelotrichaceae bacterium]